ncbi:MAG: aminotransferase class IV, partial [Balneolaceae bacterium]
NMLHYRNAFREAKSAGSDDALLLTVNQNIAETSIANIFWKKGTEVYTPSAECDILPGITRNTVCEMLSGLSNINIHEGRYMEDAIYDADTAWTTNSIAGICEVTQLNDYTFNTDKEFIDSLGKKLMARMEQPE